MHSEHSSFSQSVSMRDYYINRLSPVGLWAAAWTMTTVFWGDDLRSFIMASKSKLEPSQLISSFGWRGPCIAPVYVFSYSIYAYLFAFVCLSMSLSLSLSIFHLSVCATVYLFVSLSIISVLISLCLTAVLSVCLPIWSWLTVWLFMCFPNWSLVINLDLFWKQVFYFICPLVILPCPPLMISSKMELAYLKS